MGTATEALVVSLLIAGCGALTILAALLAAHNHPKIRRNP